MSELAGDQPAGAIPVGVTNDAAQNEAPVIENEDLGEGQSNQEPETDEIDWEDGQKYRIPRVLKDAFLKNADYTQKTQALARERETFDGEKKSHGEQVKAQQSDLAEIGEIYALKRNVDEWAKVNWLDLRNRATTVQELAQVQGLEAEYRKAQDDLTQKVGAYQNKTQQRALDAQRESAKQIEQAHAAVAKDIKEWSPEYFSKLTDFAVKNGGFKADELKAVSDPRALKLLHAAYVGSQALAREAAAKKAAAAQEAAPLPQVGNKGATANQRRASDPSGDHLSAEEWLKRRNAEIRQRNK